MTGWPFGSEVADLFSFVSHLLLVISHLNVHVPGPSKGCPMDYPTLPIGFHWALLGGSWYNVYIVMISDDLS